ncbi:MAG: DNA polymerase III subunit delta [Phycisphaeraceae bacterium]|nr:DNA polymerase III subunit delta [Phycisphaeraceae bacterium]
MAKRSAASRSTRDPEPTAAWRMVILHGPEEMRKREVLTELRRAIAQEVGEVEPKVFDGASAEPAELFDHLRTPSMFSPFNLVVVEQAEEFAGRHRELLERYAAAPADNSCLVLQASTWRPGNLDKAVARIGAKIKCEPVKQPEAIAWVTRRASEHWQAKLPRESAERLVRRRGTDLMRLDVELAKLATAAGDSRSIEPELVDELVSRTSDEQVWALQDALLNALAADRPTGSRSHAGMVIEKLHEIIDLSGQSEVLVSYAVSDLVRRLWLGANLQHRGVPDSEIGAKLKLFGPGRATFLRLMRRLNRHQLVRMFDQCIEGDRRSKSGYGTPLSNLECLCIKMVDEMG